MMRRALLALAALAICAPAWATSYTANVVNPHGTDACGTIAITGTSTASSGNWDTTTTWTPNGTPTLSDTCTVSGINYIYDGSTATSLQWNGSITITSGLAGPSQSSINTCNSANRSLSAGVYTLTLTANSLSSTQGMVLFNGGGVLPTYSIWNHICYSELYPGSGRALVHYGSFGALDQSIEELSYNHIHAGADAVFVAALGDLEVHNNSRDGAPAGSLINSGAGPLGTLASATMTGTIGVTAVNFSSVFGVTGSTTAGGVAQPGPLIDGAGIQAGTRVVTVAVYPGTSGTLSLPPVAGFTSGETVTVYAQGNVADNTVVGYTGNAQVFVLDSAGGNPGYTLLRNASDTDTGGTYAEGAAQAFYLLQDNLLLSHATGILQVYGLTSSFPSTVNTPAAFHNAIDGAYSDLRPPATGLTSSYNFFAQQGAQSVTGQGVIEMQGSGCLFLSTFDVLLNYADPGTELMLALNSQAGTSGAPCPAFVNDTFIMLNSPMGDTTCMACFGESNAGYSDAAVNSTVANSIFYDNTTYKNSAMNCRDALTTFVTSGPLGTGIYGNDIYAPGWSGSPSTGYIKSYSPCTGFDGGTPHPYAGYSDTTINPNFGTFPANAIAAWSACALKLGGLGTEAGIFGTEMFKRYQYNYSPPYTPAQMVDCLRSMATPTNAALATAGYGGVQVGALAPAAPSGPTGFICVGFCAVQIARLEQ